MFRAKNYLNRPMFHGVIQKITLTQFFETRCIYTQRWPRARLSLPRDEFQTHKSSADMGIRRRAASRWALPRISSFISY